MSMKRNIVIDGQEVAFRSPPLPSLAFTGCGFHRDIFKDLKDLVKRGLIRTIQRIPVWICSLWRCLKTSLM